MSHRVNLFQLRKPQKFLGLLASLKKQNKYRGGLSSQDVVCDVRSEGLGFKLCQDPIIIFPSTCPVALKCYVILIRTLFRPRKLKKWKQWRKTILILKRCQLC